MPLLECRDLVKRYGDLTALDGAGFTIEHGETFGLLGPNGAGKTTAISIVAGILAADSGSVSVEGKEISTTQVEGKAAIGLVPQDLAIYPDLTARENLRFFGRLQGMHRDMLDTRIDEVLEVVGLEGRADDRTDEFSGGMKRRLNIGIGLLHEPQLLILDEPTVGVDPQSRNQILESVERLGEGGIGVLYTTHYMEEAERLCDRVAIIDEGVIRAEGTRRELIGLVGERDRVRLGLGAGGEAAREQVGRLAPVHEVGLGDGHLTMLVEGASSALAEIIATVGEAGGAITTIEVEEPNLEAVFLHLTGRALRD